jgi:hypothetical protein
LNNDYNYHYSDIGVSAAWMSLRAYCSSRDIKS